MKNSILTYLLPFLMVALSPRFYSQNRYHEDQTSFFEPGEYQEHIYDSLNDLYEWVAYPMAIRILNTNGKKVNGIVFDTLSNGQLQYEGNFKNGKQDGLERTWHFNGRLISEANFTEGNLISKKCWDEEGNKIECD